MTEAKAKPARKPQARKARSAKAPAPPKGEKNPDSLTVQMVRGESEAETMAPLHMGPFVRHAAAAREMNDGIMGCKSDLDRSVALVKEAAADVRDGELGGITDILTAQMITLDALFSSMVLRAKVNAEKGYGEAVQRYANIALKAQARCQVTAEALAKIKRGGKQVIQIVHVHEGGQAVVAETVNNGGAADERRKRERAGNAAVAALLSEDPQGDTLPIPSNARQEAVPIARGQVDGRAEGQ